MSDPTYLRYLRYAHAGPVAVGDEWTEFVNCGCASPEDVVLRVEAVDGGTAIGADTTIDVVARKGRCRGRRRPGGRDGPGERPAPAVRLFASCFGFRTATRTQAAQLFGPSSSSVACAAVDALATGVDGDDVPVVRRFLRSVLGQPLDEGVSLQLEQVEFLAQVSETGGVGLAGRSVLVPAVVGDREVAREDHRVVRQLEDSFVQ